MNIRLAVTDDCSQCAHLSKIAELTCADGTFVSIEYYKKLIDVDELFFVAEDNGIVIGLILGEPLKGNLALVSLFTVAKEYRGKGIGAKLISTFEKKCQENDIKHIMLFAPSFNESTVEFYRKKQFIAGKEHIIFWKDI